MQQDLNDLPEHTARTTELDQDFRRIPEYWTMKILCTPSHKCQVLRF